MTGERLAAHPICLLLIISDLFSHPPTPSVVVDTPVLTRQEISPPPSWVLFEKAPSGAFRATPFGARPAELSLTHGASAALPVSVIEVLANGRKYFAAGFSNDNPPHELIWLVPKSQRESINPKYADDDGDTGNFFIEGFSTEQNDQLMVSIDASALTEKRGPRRTDLAEVVIQLNHQFQLKEDTAVFVGSGAGLQAQGKIGDGFRPIQQSIHQAINSGRIGANLQSQYPDDGRLGVAPLLTLGVRLEQTLIKNSVWTIKTFGELQGRFGIALEALSVVQGKAGFAINVENIGTLSIAATATTELSPGTSLAFLNVNNQVHVGQQVIVDFDRLAQAMGSPISPFGQYSRNGFLGDTTFTAGLSVPLDGQKGWFARRR